MRTGRPQKIDRKLLHEFLWTTRDRSGFMTQKQGQLAKEFGVTAATMSLIFKELIDDNRVKKMGKRWLVNDPAHLKWETDFAPDSLF